MRFELIILGTSSAIPTRERNLSAQILNHNDRYSLIDCGEGTQIQLRRHKISFQRIDRVFISHLHADHYLGLPGLLATMDLLGRTSPLDVYCPEGLEELIHVNFKISDSGVNYQLNFISVKPDQKVVIFENNHLKVSSIPLVHGVPCTGFLFEEKPRLRRLNKKILQQFFLTIDEIMSIKAGNDYSAPDGTFYPNNVLTYDPAGPRSFAYCSDTAFNEALPELIGPVNLLYHEATFTEQNKERAVQTSHSTAAQAAEIARRTGASKLVIGHFSTRYPDSDVLVTEARAIFPETYAAVEGEVIPVI